MPNQPGDLGRNNYFSSNPRSDTFYSISTRLDHQLSNKQHAFVRYTRNNRRESRNAYFGTVNGVVPTGNFGDIFAALVREDQAKGQRVNKRNEVIAPFSPDSFRYASFQSIFSRSQLKPDPTNGDNPNWSQQQHQAMYLLKLNTSDPEVAASTDPNVIAQAQQYQAELTSEQAIARVCCAARSSSSAI